MAALPVAASAAVEVASAAVFAAVVVGLQELMLAMGLMQAG